LDREAIGREVLERWAKGVDAARAFRQRHPALADRFIDIPYEWLVRDPIAAVGAIYCRFDLRLDDRTRARMRAFLARNPQHKAGRHIYSLGEYNLSETAVAEKFARYLGELELLRAEAMGRPADLPTGVPGNAKSRPGHTGVREGDLAASLH